MNKRCLKCDTTKPLTSAYWYRHHGTRDGWETWCKACVNQARREVYRGSVVVQQVSANCKARARSIVEEFKAELKRGK